jgi:hypothetical protein
VGEADLKSTQILYPLVQEGIRNGLYFPNRQSTLCSRRNCAFWRQCEREFGGESGIWPGLEAVNGLTSGAEQL